MFRLELSRGAAKFYQKADNVTLKRLNLAFSKLAEDPFRHYNIKRLSGELEGSFRLRLGDFESYILSTTTKKLFILRSTVSGEMSIRLSETLHSSPTPHQDSRYCRGLPYWFFSPLACFMIRLNGAKDFHKRRTIIPRLLGHPGIKIQKGQANYY